MIARVAGNRSRPITGKSAGIPRTDPGNPHPSAMCLMFTSFLDIPFSPQVQLLNHSSEIFLLFPDIRTRSHPYDFLLQSCDAPATFYQALDKTLRVGPSAFHLCGAMLALESAYHDLSHVTPVCFLGKS